MAKCTFCDQEMTDPHVTSCTGKDEIEYPDGTVLVAIPAKHRCHDCWVMPGGLHHAGCDMEECPRCHGQLLSCECDDEQKLADFLAEAADVQGTYGLSREVDSALFNRMIPVTIDELIQQAYTNAVAHGWHDEPRSFFEELMLLVTEIAEAAEEYRSHRGLNEIYFREDGKPEGIPVELADLMIRLGDLAGAHNIDLAYATELKMDFNRTRTWRHGNKKI